MKRVMINLSDEVGQKLDRRLAVEKISASKYGVGLIEADLRAAGLLPDGDAALLDAVREAKASGVDVIRELARAQRAKARRAAR